MSVIIPMWNEARYIEGCVDSVLQNDYPRDSLEIVIVDGNSRDGSRAVAERYAARFPFVRVVDNPNGITPAALNVGVKESHGEIIVWLSAHAEYDSRYIRRTVKLLRRTGAASVGGVLVPVGEGYIGQLVAIAARNPFAVGDASYRYARRPQWSDTVFGGAWYRQTLDRLGGFDERRVINSDYEFHYRLRRAGGRVLLSPSLRSRYFVRRSLRALALQYLRYGRWKVATLVSHPDSLRWRQLVPPLFVLALMLSGLAAAVRPVLGAVVPGTYLAASMAAGLQAGARYGWRYVPMFPVVVAVMHLAWGAGFWAGLARFGVPGLSWRAIAGAFRSVA